jgi:hypothetical protein
MYLQTLSRGVDKLEMRHGFAAGDQNLDFNSYISTKISTLIVLGFQGGTNSPPIWLINKFFFSKRLYNVPKNYEISFYHKQ